MQTTKLKNQVNSDSAFQIGPILYYDIHELSTLPFELKPWYIRHAPATIMTNSDKRRGPRIKFDVSVDVKSDSLLQKFHAKNLSQGGIFLEVPGPQAAAIAKVGSKLELKFAIPGFTNPLKIKGKIIYVHRYETLTDESFTSEKKIGLGIQFEELTAKETQLLSEFVSGKHVSVA